MSYYSIDVFHDKVYNLRNRLHDKLYHEMNRKYRGRLMVLRNNIYITVKYRQGNKVVDILDSRIQGITLDKNIPFDVYQTNRKIGAGKEFVEVECIIVFNIASIDSNDKDVLGLGDEGYTFNTYEELLSRVHEKTKGFDSPDVAMDIHLIDLQSGVNLLHVFNQLRNNNYIPELEIDQLTNLNNYQKLDSAIKAKVDKILCPLKVTKNDVKVPYLGHTLNITVDKEILVKAYFFTNKWNKVVTEELGI